MKHFLLSALLLIIFTPDIFCQSIGFNDNNSDPNASAMVDVYSTNKGMLIPRVSLDSTLLSSPVTNPATSLLVYNTASVHDVKPGFYFWNGTRWDRLETGSENEINFAPVVINSDATLLKSENMVLASGNTTVTLPAVTAEDNGLEIVIKNIGTYTDLVIVKPEPGKKIDASDSSRLTRWNGRVYLAYNSNWVVKYKEAGADNLLDVSATGSFTTIDEVIAYLDLHMNAPTVVRLGGGAYPVSSTVKIDLPFPVTIQGLSFGETTIECPGGDTAFNAVSECYFKMLTFQADETGGIGINLSGPQTYFEIKDAFFNDFTKAVIITDASELWLFETDFYTCSASGLEIDAGSDNNTVFRSSECDFYDCLVGIHLISSGPETESSILNCTFYNESEVQKGILYVPTTGTDNFRFITMIIQNNSFNTVGSFAAGFEFSRLDGRDAHVFMENNAGVPAENPHVHINILNNGTNTNLASAGTYYKVIIQSSVQTVHTTKWDAASDTTNRIRYLPVNVRDGFAFVSGNISNRNGNNRTANIAVVKNGVPTAPLGITTVYMGTVNQSYPFSTVVYLHMINENDYFEIWVSSPTNNDVIKIDDLNWFTDTN